MSDEFDPFAGESGLLNDYDGTVVDAAWVRGDYGMNLVLTIETDNQGTPEVENRYSCGQDWECYDGGETVEHPQKRRTFNNQTGVIKLFQHALKSGAENVIRRRNTEQFSGMGHLHASIWKGLRFHWMIVEETTKRRNRESGQMEEQTSVKPFPSSFIGEVATQGRLDGVGAQGPAQGPQRQGAEQGGGSGQTSHPALADVDASTVARIKILAKTQPYEQWVDSVLELGVSSNELIKALSDQSLYDTLRG